MFAFKTDDNGRLTEWGDSVLIPDGIETETLPEFPEDFVYRDGEFVYEPIIPIEATALEPTAFDILEAQVTYTAIMTDTLLEV